MNFPQTADELLRWDFYTTRDETYGNYSVITGFEGQGGCFWCGNELTGKQKKFCRGHWTQYWKHFGWSYARSWCLKRYEYKCANCGYHQIVPEGDHPSWYTEGLEAHHIIPLKGEIRSLTPFNIYWNLICLCHDCHQEIHAVMREASKPIAPDSFELAIKNGQGVFSFLY